MQELIERIFARNPDDFYEQSYRGLYCVGCEAFKQPTPRSWTASASCIPPARSSGWRSGTGSSGCPATRTSSRGLIESQPEFIQPESRRNEILGLLDQGLEDISASRARFGWGVPFPRPTSEGEQQTTYVWFDALPNYWTATRLPGAGADVARPAARDRQGHHPLPLRHLARDARGRRAAAAGAGLGPRLRAARRRAVQQERRASSSTWARRSTASGPMRSATSCCARSPGTATATSPGSDSRSATSPTSPTDFGNLASRSLAMIAKYRDGMVPGQRPTPRSTTKGARRGRATPRPWTPSTSAARRRAAGRAGHRCQPVHRADGTLGPGQDWRRETRSTPPLPHWRAASRAWRCCRSPFMPGKSAELWALLGGSDGRATDGVGNSDGSRGRRVARQKARGTLSQAPIRHRSRQNRLSHCAHNALSSISASLTSGWPGLSLPSAFFLPGGAVPPSSRCCRRSMAKRRWTVMLIPHGTERSRILEVTSSWLRLGAIGVAVILGVAILTGYAHCLSCRTRGLRRGPADPPQQPRRRTRPPQCPPGRPDRHHQHDFTPRRADPGAGRPRTAQAGSALGRHRWSGRAAPELGGCRPPLRACRPGAGGHQRPGPPRRPAGPLVRRGGRQPRVASRPDGRHAVDHADAGLAHQRVPVDAGTPDPAHGAAARGHRRRGPDGHPDRGPGRRRRGVLRPGNRLWQRHHHRPRLRHPDQVRALLQADGRRRAPR